MALKVGIVGMGGIGNLHADCYAKDPLVKVVAVCDLIKERAKQAAEKLGVEAYYTLSDMLKNEEMDFVDVTTGGMENSSWHYEPAIEAIESGQNVLIEKPLCADINEARELVRLAAKKKLYLGCNLNHYFTPVAERAKQYINEGQVGEMVYCLHKMGFNGGEATYSPPPPRFKDYPYSHAKAFLTHPFSVMRYFCGDITHVQAFMDRPGCRKSACDIMLSITSIHVRFANGCVGYLLSQRGDAAYGLGGWWSLEVAGTKGTFCIENCIEKVTYWPAPKPGTTDSGPEVMNTGIVDFNETFPRRLHAFLEDITNGIPPEMIRASGRDALAALEYTWAAIESYEQGGALVRPNALPPFHGDPRFM
ncbi:MAG: Gfo/Idh/MocA family oxidoreductase [Clostridiales bacterium]|nr:Gfo/Idh/MocA family oxidoreductase [Clostridiales bacterium]